MLARRLPSTISLLCALTLLAAEFVTLVIGKEYSVPCLDSGNGNTALLDTTIKLLSPGDVLLLGACKYNFEDDYFLGRFYSKNNEGVETIINNAPDPDKFGGEEGVLIKGTGKNAGKTVLYTVIDSFPVNAIFENLTISGEKSEAPSVYNTDADQAILFRTCVLISGANTSRSNFSAVFSLSGKLSFIDSKIISGPSSAADNATGVWVESGPFHRLGLMRSEIKKFPIGIYASRWERDEEWNQKDSIKVHKTKLFSNSVKCCIKGSNDGKCIDDSCPLDDQNRNTPAGNPTIEMNESIDLLGEYDYGKEVYLPLKIYFPEVTTKGHTFTYQLYSAHPALPMHGGNQYHSGIADPQYFQFDSTAVLSTQKKKAVVISFDKSVVDSKFVNSENIEAFHSVNGKTWKNKSLKLKVKTVDGTSVYQVRMPKRKNLKSLIAFGEIENDG